MSDELKTIDILAQKFLSPAEYASFVDIISTIDKRAAKFLSAVETNSTENNHDEIKNIKYPYDIDIGLNLTVFKNNQLGQRLEIINTLNQSFLKKIYIGQDVEPAIKELMDLLNNYCTK